MTLSRMKLAAIALAVFTAPVQAGPLETVTVAGGCFWCVESDFEKVRGVKSAVSGFSGGSVADPSYKQVVGGGTGHREVVQITFDTDRLSLDQFFDTFLRTVDPTDAGGQFCDRGFTYTTAIYAANPAQKEAAERAIAKAERELGQKVVTPVETFNAFYPADAYHQDYYKSEDRVLTRFGYVTKAKAYKRYRKACGRDSRVAQLWNSASPVARAN